MLHFVAFVFLFCQCKFYINFCTFGCVEKCIEIKSLKIDIYRLIYKNMRMRILASK